MKTLADILDRRRFEITVLWIVFAIWVFSQYMYRFGHEELYGFSTGLQYVKGFLRYMVAPWLVTLMLVLCGYVAGRAVLKLVLRGFSYRSHLDESIFSIGVGLGLLSILTFIVGLLKLLYPILFLVMALAILAVGYMHIVHLVQVTAAGLRNNRWTALDWFLLLILSAFVLSTFLRPNNPSFGGDPMNSHLAAPGYYLRDHAVTFLAWINFNNFPQLQEMLLTLQMMILKDPGSSLIYLYMVGSATLTYLIGARYFTRSTGLIAAGLFLLIPEVYRDSQAAYVEHILVFYSLLMTSAFLGWYESRDSRWLVLIGVSAGLACGAKYLGLLTTLIILVLIAISRFLPISGWERDRLGVSPGVHDRSENQSRPVIEITRQIGIVLLWTVIIASPWYLRNIVYFGNPFFPFFESIFGGMQLGTLNSLRGELTVDHAAMLKYFSFEPGIRNLAALPWNLTFHHNHPNTYYVPSKIGPFLLALTPAVLFVGRWRRIATMMVLFAILFYAYWFLVEQIEYQRYLMSVYPLHCLIAAWGIAELFSLEAFDIRNRTHLAWLMVAIALSFMFFVKTTTMYAYSGRQLMFASEEDRSDFLIERFPDWNLIETINSQIEGYSELFDENTRIYGMANQTRRYYLDCPLIGNPWAYGSYFQFMDNASTGAELYSWLQDYDCGYLLYSEDGAAIMAYILEIRLPDDPSFDTYFEEIASAGDTHLYMLLQPGQGRAGPMVSGPAGIPREIPPIAGPPTPEELEGRIQELEAPF